MPNIFKGIQVQIIYLACMHAENKLYVKNTCRNFKAQKLNVNFMFMKVKVVVKKITCELLI